jgi:hypothetical protein
MDGLRPEAPSDNPFNHPSYLEHVIYIDTRINAHFIHHHHHILG